MDLITVKLLATANVFIKHFFLCFLFMPYVHVIVFVKLAPNFRSRLLTSIDVVEAQFIYICIFKISICKPKFKVHLCLCWVQREKVKEIEQLIHKKNINT